MNLSDKVKGEKYPILHVPDVKEFIKRVIDRFEEKPNIQITHTTIKAILREEAGEKLCL